MLKVWAQSETSVTQTGPHAHAVWGPVAGGLSTDLTREVRARTRVALWAVIKEESGSGRAQ